MDPTPSHPDRRAFVRGALGAAACALGACNTEPASRPADAVGSESNTMPRPPNQRMPLLFVGHGSPMNAIEDNTWSRAFRALAVDLPPPRAILAVSAHWFTDGTFLTANDRPPTIHDFGGFPQRLFEIEYPAPGHRDLAQRVRALLRERADAAPAELRVDWGLDHGTWSVLLHLYPAADVPVVQLSIDRRLDARGHFELGRSLAALRDDGVLVLGSGNITHNLGLAFASMQSGDTTTPEWASAFDRAVASALQQRDAARLMSLWPGTANGGGRLAHPSPDHWWPLLYAAAASDDRDSITFPVEGFDLGSLSMRAVRFG